MSPIHLCSMTRSYVKMDCEGDGVIRPRDMTRTCDVTHSYDMIYACDMTCDMTHPCDS